MVINMSHYTVYTHRETGHWTGNSNKHVTLYSIQNTGKQGTGLGMVLNMSHYTVHRETGHRTGKGTRQDTLYSTQGNRALYWE